MRRIIIVGKGPGWQKAPHEVEDGQVWGVNNVCLRRKVDLVFNMHDLYKHGSHPLFNKTIEYVNEHRIPIVTQKKYAHIPTSIPFPLDSFNRQYFTNSIDYMVAYAHYLDSFEEYKSIIDMFGVVMAVGTEYAIQRPSLEYWIGVFEGQGGEVLIHRPSFVCDNPRGLYGYEWDEEDAPHVLVRPENRR